MKKQNLKNGIKLITTPMQGTNTVTVLVMIGSGSKYENIKNNGISHFLEHMFFKGTEKRPDTMAISGELDGMGVDFNAFTGKEYTGYWIKSSADKLDRAFDILSDMLCHSKMDTKEINREKGVIIEELNMYLDNPMIFVDEIFEKCLYGDVPAGWDTIGTRENILAFTRKDFTEYLDNQYGAKNIVISIAGNIPGEVKLKKLVNKYFQNKVLEDRGKNFFEKEKVAEDQDSPRSEIEYKKTDQAHISLGVRTIGYGHKERIIHKMISLILGGSMSSRLFINLRERKGLAYYVRTDSENYTDSGYLTTKAGVPVGKVKESIKIILSEYKKLKDEKVSKKELQRTKDMIRGKLAIQLESSDSQANWYARQEVLYSAIGREFGKNDYEIATPDDYLDKIDQITVNDIQRVAKEIFVSKNLNLAMIGPFKNNSEFEKLMKV